MAERVAFGTPVDPAEDDIKIHVAERPTAALVGRILLAAIFVLSGTMKIVNHDQTVEHMVSAGIPAANVLAYVAGLAEVLGGLALVFGFLTRVAAMGLIAFMIVTTLAFHGFWNFEGQEQKTQMVNFMKNLAIIGGLFTVVAFGPSRYSIDRKIREPIGP
jgi:putative oxidoreductase